MCIFLNLELPNDSAKFTFLHSLWFFWKWPFIAVFMNTWIFKQCCAWFAILSCFLSKKTNFVCTSCCWPTSKGWSTYRQLKQTVCRQIMNLHMSTKRISNSYEQNNLSECNVWGMSVHTSFANWRKDCVHWVVCSLQFVQHQSVW